MSAEAHKWFDEACEEDLPLTCRSLASARPYDERRQESGERRGDGQTTAARPERPTAGDLRASAPSWNVLAEELVAFPRPAHRLFLGEVSPLDATDRRDTRGRSYGEAWLDGELERLKRRTAAAFPPGVAEQGPRAPRPPARAAVEPKLRVTALQQPRTDLARPRGIGILPSGGHLGGTGDLFAVSVSSPERRARGARAAVRPRTRTALSEPRGLRRLLPGAATLAVLAGVLMGASALASADHRPITTLPGSVKTPGGWVYVARPGDTLWSIATRLQPTGDPRPIVAKLQSELRGSELVPGDRLLLP
jgi:hypothetical protein